MEHPLVPVTVSIVGTGNTSGGGDAPTPNGTIAETPRGQPNLLVNVVSPLMAIAVRFGNSFLTSFVALITLAGIGVTGQVVGADVGTIISTAAYSSLAIAGVETLKNLVTIFGRLEGRFPLATGSI